MTLRFNHRLRRLENRLTELKYWIDRSYIDLDGWRFNGSPIERGAFWPTRQGVVTFDRDIVTVPAEWELSDTMLELRLGGEGLLHLRYGDGEEEFGVDQYHWRFPLRDRTLALHIDIVARSPFGVPKRDARLEVARLVLVDRAVERFERQIRLIHETVKVLGEEHDASAPLITVAERALAALDWPSGTVNYVSRTASSTDLQRVWELPEGLEPDPSPLNASQRDSVLVASARLDEELGRLQQVYPPEGKLRLTGHAHIDLAWLWPLEETRRKGRRTFSTALSLLKRYPEFHFTQSTAQLYAFIEEDDPDLFRQIQEEVAAGRWEPIGGSWVEFDTNMPSGESFVRQLLYGQRYFESRFGRRHDVVWLPDTFGFTPALPQLFRGAGMENFFTIKLTWSESNRFPHDLFLWEGLDGSRVLAHLFDNPDGGYNGNPRPRAILNTWRNYRGKYRHGESLLSIGEGDGGGGVTREMLEAARDEKPFPVLPVLRFGTVHDYYQDTRRALEGQLLPLWVGEMYLELHRGTLTTQGRTKFLHRHAERDLVAAEVLASLNYIAGDPEPPSLEQYWHLVLRNQFHDILPGSSIREVYERAEEELGRVIDEANGIHRSQLQRLVERLAPGSCRPAVLAVNPDLSARPLRLESPEALPGGQTVEGGSVLSGDLTVPPLGAMVLLGVTAAGGLSVSARHLENRYIRVSIDERGALTSVWDKRAQREVLSGRGNQLWVYVDKPRDFDAWDIDEGYVGEGQEIDEAEAITVLEDGPHRSALRVERRFRNSRIVQDIRLWANSARLEFKTTFDWHDRHWLLKARFPLAIRTGTATFETAFGVVERSTYRNTSWQEAQFEVAAHRFVDLSEPDYGVALLNDGKYGHDVLGGEVGISLLRSPVYPDPLADEGLGSCTYALYLHQGTWWEGGVLMEAEDLNRPLLVQSCEADSDVTWQPLIVDGLPLGLGTLKVTEDGGGLVLRAYEPRGARGAVRFQLPEGWRLAGELNLLEDVVGDSALTFTPFQVRSWLLRRE